MAKKSKLELVMELGDKLFNNKLSQVQAKLSAATDKMEGKLKHFNMTQVKIFSGIGESFDPVAMNSIAEMADNITGKLDFTKDISNTKTALGQMGVENVDAMAAKVHKLAKVWNENEMEIAKSANAITKQVGGSFDENLSLIQKGFEKGANLNGDMLDQLKEYGPAMRENGMSVKDMLGVMANAGKDGVFSDKALDSLKEGGLSIREFGKAQEEALNGIGMKIGDITGKTSWQAMQLISENMKGMTTQARQLVLADIFKGAGEDGGMALIEGLANGMIPFDQIPEFKQADEGLKGFVAGIESYVSDKMGGMMPYLQGISMSIITLGSLISIIQSLTAAQWLSNIAAAASPYMWIVIAIGAVIAVIAIAINKFDEWGATLLFLLGPIGRVIMAFKLIYNHWDSIVQAFKSDGILGGLKRIGEVLMDVILLPLQQILELLANIDPTGLAQKGADAVKDFRNGHGLVITEKPSIGNADATDPLGLNFKTPTWPTAVKQLSKAPVLDGKIAPGAGKKDKKTGENISKVTGQANQVRNITFHIDAFIKGGINMAQSATEGMSKEDMEAYLKELFRRLIDNAETA